MPTPPGDEVYLELGLPLVSYPGDQVPMQIPPPAIIPPLPVVRYKYKSWGIPWGQAGLLQIERGIPWSMGSSRKKMILLRTSTAPLLPREWKLSWTIAQNLRLEWELNWSKGSRLSREVEIGWIRIPKVNKSDVLVRWGVGTRLPRSVSIPWLNPPRKAHEVSIGSRLAGSRVAYEASISWGGFRSFRFLWNIPWGQAVRVPWLPHGGGFQPPHPPHPPGYVAPRGDRVYMRLSCPLYDYPGDQVPLRLGPSQCYYDFPAPGVYIVENEVEVVRLPEGTQIHIKSLSLSISTDSIFWDFRAQLSRPADLEYLKKGGDGVLKEIEVRINGHVWRILVEDWDGNRTLFGDTSIMGRSRTCLLDSPNAPTRSYLEEEVRTSQQLMEQEVASTGFELEHNELDWVVPANVWSYQGLSPIGAIKEIAAASGSVVISHQWDSKLMIYPRYPISTWDWATSLPDVTVFDGAASRVTFSNKSLPKYDYIFVSGETQGVGDPILREGSGGEIRAEMITHRLITTHPVAAERGRNSLCNRGEQGLFTIVLPLFHPDTAPGMLAPMQLVDFHEAPVAWKGLLTSNTIDVVVSDDGTLSIWQTGTLERHYDPD